MASSTRVHCIGQWLRTPIGIFRVGTPGRKMRLNQHATRGDVTRVWRCY